MVTHLKIQQAPFENAVDIVSMIRRIVFQEEQNIPADVEFDGQDAQSQHLLAYLNDLPVGTVRMRAINAQTAKIERLAVLPEARGQGIGQKLMSTALNLLEKEGYSEVIIHAQEYIKNLHEKLGFQPEGNRFDEAGISHIKMVKKLK